jgi:hypothetical protein
VLIGFASSLYLRPFFNEPLDALRNVLLTAGAPAPKMPLPLYLWAHGIVLTAWFVLVVAQTGLIAAGRTALHRRLGIVGVVLAVLLVITSAMATLRLPVRATAAGVADSPIVAQLRQGNTAALVVFSVLVAIAIVVRRRGEVHKRLLLIATLNIVPPAAARLAGTITFAGIGETTAIAVSFGGLIAMAASLIVYDVVTRRRPHPATLIGLALVFVLPAIVFAIVGTLGA